MILTIIFSVGCTLVAVALLGLFVWWLTGLCMRYDANEPGWTDWSKASYDQVERNMVERFMGVNAYENDGPIRKDP